MARPQLQTDRLLLRPFELTDAAIVDTLAGDWEIAKTTLNIPHPYPEGAAEAWIRRIHESMDNGTGFSLAVVRKADGALLGCSAIHLTPAHRKGELAYWVGRPYWGHGYATEAARAVMHFGFTALQLNRIFAAYMTHRYCVLRHPPVRVCRLKSKALAGTTRQGFARHALKNTP